MTWPRLLLLLCACALAAALSSCVALNDPETSQEHAQHVIGIAQPDHLVGQTVVSQRPRPHEITLQVRPESGYPPGAILKVEIYPAPGGQPRLATYAYRLKALEHNPAVTVPLEGVGQSFYVSMTTNAGAAEVLGRDEDAYPPGQAYQDGAPLTSDLAFSLKYNYDFAAFLDDLSLWAGQGWLILPLLVVLILPGWLLLSASRLGASFDWGERVGLSLGLSLAVIPLVLLWTTALGLHWSRTGLYVLAGLLAAATLWGLLQRRRSGRPPVANEHPRSNRVVNLALAGIFLASIGVRLIMVRDLVAPPWVDSVHHGLIARLIAKQGAYPNSYQPYLGLDTASYHSGYHAGLAFFQQLSGQELIPAMLLYGQVLNALAVFAAYLLTKTLTRNSLAGLFAALFTGLFMPMPAYYTSWGRYTQLTGLLILPAAFALLYALLSPPHRSSAIGMWPRHAFIQRLSGLLAFHDPQIRGSLWLAALACSGLFLAHYRVTAFLACLVVAWLLVETIFDLHARNQAGKNLIARLVRLVLAAALSLLCVFPWLPGAFSSLFVPFVQSPRRTQPPFSDFTWSYLDAAWGEYILGLAVVGLAWSLLSRRRFGYTLLLWVVLLFLLANLSAWFASANGLVNNTAVEIALFLPLAALSGYLLAWVIAGWRGFLPARWRLLFDIPLLLVLGVVSLLAARELVKIINPGTLLARQADLPALAWAEENLPADAQVLVNPFLWGYGVYAGSDGGYWLAPAAGLQTLPAPVLYGLEYRRPSTRETIENSQKVIELSSSPRDLAAFLAQAGIEYVFIGRRGGVLSPSLLSDSQEFNRIYYNEGVYIFQVISD